MLPSLSTTTLPWHGPITDFPSGPRPQPGTVSNVIRPPPIRTGWALSPAETGRATPKRRAKATEVGRFFMTWIPHGVGGVAGSSPTPSSRRTTGDGQGDESIPQETDFQSGRPAHDGMGRIRSRLRPFELG